MKLRVVEHKKPVRKSVIFAWIIAILLVISLCLYYNKPREVTCVTDGLPSEDPRNLANLPLKLYNHCTLDSPKLFIGKKCTKFPPLHQIEFDNLLWQKTSIDGVEIYLFGAYYDTRRLGAVIRTLAVSEGGVPPKATCQIWFKNHGTVIEAKIDVLTSSQASYRSLLISCDVSEIFDDRIPHSVSIASYECAKSTNVLQITTDFNQTIKNDFAVCTTSLFQEISPRGLIEWIEFVKSLGATKIFVYNLFQTEEIRMVTNYYEQEGTLNLTPMVLPGKSPNLEVLQREIPSLERSQWSIVPSHDCFYSHLHEYQRISFMKIDEISLPLNGSTNWSDWQFETLKNLSTKPDGTEISRSDDRKRIFSYDTTQVVSIGDKTTSDKCLFEKSCDINDVSIEFSKLSRGDLVTLKNNVREVLKKLIR